MTFTFFLLSVLLHISTSNAAIFLWSNKKLEISPLQPFTKEHLSNLTNELGNPDVYYFRCTSRISPEIKKIINGYYSAYVPNGDMDIEESIDLPGSYLLDAEKIQETLNQSNKSDNILSVIIIPHKQHKRQTEKSTSEPSVMKTASKKKETVMYKSQNKNNKLFALLYSSKPLLFKTNDTELAEIHLGNTQDDMIIYDARLNVQVILQDGSKIVLRFSFSRLNGYWSLPSVRVTDMKTSRVYNLTTDEDIVAPAHFSYHCNGHTVFYDGSGAELHIYDLQVQVDSTNGKFGDANDCVSFTTAPIWSGLFVTTLLGIGLIVALTAIMDIKTMDKFDNYKTKNLNITVSE